MSTVKIRIAVAVDPKGRWYAHGQSTDSGAPFPSNHDELLETVDIAECGPNEALFWVTAELPIPETAEVAGEALPADPQ